MKTNQNSTIQLIYDFILESRVNRFLKVSLYDYIKSKGNNVGTSSIDIYLGNLRTVGILDKSEIKGAYDIVIKDPYRLGTSELATYSYDVRHERNTDIWSVHMKRFNPIRFEIDKDTRKTIKIVPEEHMNFRQRTIFKPSYE